MLQRADGHHWPSFATMNPYASNPNVQQQQQQQNPYQLQQFTAGGQMQQMQQMQQWQQQQIERPPPVGLPLRLRAGNGRVNNARRP